MRRIAYVTQKLDFFHCVPAKCPTSTKDSRSGKKWTPVFFCLSWNIGSVISKNISCYCKTITFIESKYPKNIAFNFENKMTDGQLYICDSMPGVWVVHSLGLVHKKPGNKPIHHYGHPEHCRKKIFQMINNYQSMQYRYSFPWSLKVHSLA